MTPTPPPGWEAHEVTPASQQQAQDTVLGYLKKTLAALPPGTAFDASRYSGGSTAPCEDDPAKNPPVSFSATGDLKLPPGVESGQFVAEVGDVWKSWGWWVYERDGTYKPNRVGSSPDGYELYVGVPGLPGAPHISGTSPCFPHDLARADLPFPVVITAG
ncbi:hypothetical protein D2E73_08500 [Mycobacteroides abscessus]|nr:hypothetical protein D2E73_08500 [Mycobacteroides abscessus]RIT32663.1 hypothetical protein D2E99_18430 [Mycobacteroides abscessus]